MTEESNNITELSVTQPEVKPGIRTTEFWLVVAVNLLAVLAQHLENVDTQDAVIALAIVNGLYAIARSYVKGKTIIALALPLLLLLP